jgi:serine/threonine-protein kinase
MEVYVTRFPKPEGRWAVSTSGGTHPVWRHDGHELYYRARDGFLMAVSVGATDAFQASAPQRLFDPKALRSGIGLGTEYDITPDGRFLVNVVVDRTSPPATVILNWRRQ